MPSVGLKLRIPVFEWTKMVHALHLAATAIAKMSKLFLIYVHVIICLSLKTVTASIISDHLDCDSLWCSALKIEATSSSETSVYTRNTISCRNVEDYNLQCYPNNKPWRPIEL
jgi:hypothetical protein